MDCPPKSVFPDTCAKMAKVAQVAKTMGDQGGKACLKAIETIGAIGAIEADYRSYRSYRIYSKKKESVLPRSPTFIKKSTLTSTFCHQRPRSFLMASTLALASATAPG